MDFLKIFLAALVGVIVMTLFSYTISTAFRKLFKEPVLLNLLLDRAGIVRISDVHKNMLGWILHFFIGLIFVILYDRIWAWTTLEPSWINGLIFGVVNGIVGMPGWWLLFKIHPNEPKIDFKNYSWHLFIAHILFALGATAVYLYF